MQAVSGDDVFYGPDYIEWSTSVTVVILAADDRILSCSSDIMSSVIRLDIHPVVLLEISDHHLRSKHKHGFGVLIGDHSDEARILNSYASFELLLNDDTSAQEEYFIKRYNQLKTVLPNAYLLGLYHVGELITPPDSVRTLLDQLRLLAGLENSRQELLYTMVSGTPGEDKIPFATYVNGGSDTIPTALLSSDSEFIAANTALAHSNYSRRERDNSKINIPSAAQHTEAVMNSVETLKSKIAQVNSYIEGDQALANPENQQEINLLISHLAQKLNQLGNPQKTSSDTVGTDNHQSDAMILGLLTEQAIATEELSLRMFQSILQRGSGIGLR